MKKVLIFSIIFAILMLFASTLVYASEIDMNLTDGSSSDSTVYGSSNPADTPREQSTVSPTQFPSTSAALSETNLTLSNILNIILIVLGILLVLFAIAILLRLR